MLYIDCTELLTGRLDGGYFSVWPVVEELNKVARIKLIVDKKHTHLVPDGFSFVPVKKLFKFYFFPKNNSEEDTVIWAPLNYVYAFNTGKAKIISTIHDIRFFEHKNSVPVIKRFVRGKLLIRTIKVSSVIVCISNFTKNSVISYMNNKGLEVENTKMVVIYNPFIDMTSNLIDEEIPFDNYLFSLSSGAVNKNTDLLISAFKKYLDQGGEYFLVLAGLSDEKFLEYTNIITGYPKIKLFKKISNNLKANLYKKCIAFIWPSTFEGFGLPGLEAKYFNKPLICSDIEINRELFSGEIFFNPYDEEALIKCFFDFKNIKSTEFELDKFNLNSIVQKYVTLMELDAILRK